MTAAAKSKFGLNVSIDEMEQIAREIRGEVVTMSNRGKAPHLGSALSCVDILVAAYWGFMDIDPSRPLDPDRDRLILSKGHAAQALYAALAHRGFFNRSVLETYNTDGAALAEHPGPGCVPGIEAATGSLGHGPPIGTGMAIAARLQNKDFRVIVVSSDGECNEGSTWEAAALAGGHGLENLCVIVDYNGWQATGRSAEITAIDPLVDKWASFGWAAEEVDGNNVAQLTAALERLPAAGKPSAIIARTVKGRGVSFMEDDNNWHYRIPTEEEVEMAKKELGLN
jgi:transketolase